MLVVLAADKGAPGVTTSTLALAAAWKDSVPMVVEADPAGGDLAMMLLDRNGQRLLPASPTVATLAAQARGNSQVVLEQAVAVGERQNSSPGDAGGVRAWLRVVPGYASAEDGRGMSGLWEDLADALRTADADVLVDVGRLDAASPAMKIVERASVIVLVASPDLISYTRTRDRARALQRAMPSLPIVPLVVTLDRDGQDHRRDLDDVLAGSGVEAADAVHLPWDPNTVAALRTGVSPATRSVARTRFMRAAQVAADQISSLRPARAGELEGGIR